METKQYLRSLAPFKTRHAHVLLPNNPATIRSSRFLGRLPIAFVIPLVLRRTMATAYRYPTHSRLALTLRDMLHS
jgi:hypothetical protein